MKQLAYYLVVGVGTFLVARAFLGRTRPAVAPPPVVATAPATTPAVRAPASRATITPGTPARAAAANEGRSLLDDEAWNDVMRLQVSDPRASLLTFALVKWVSERAKHCLPRGDAAKATSVVRVLVEMSSSPELATIDGRGADVRVIEGAPLADETLACIRKSTDALSAVPLSSIDPGTRQVLQRQLGDEVRATFPSGFRGSAAMQMHVRCKG